MESLTISRSIIYYLVILVLVQFYFSAAVPARNSISLYNANDKLNILSGQNFSSMVYESKTAWLVEFYASWCGHCQTYAKTCREIGIDTWGWRTVIRIGAINCYSDENNAVCSQHDIRVYPTLRFIEPQSMLNTSKRIDIPATDAKGVERGLISQLDGLHRTDDFWPKFNPMSFVTFDDLYNQISPSVKVVIVIVEKRDEFTGRQIMLDFSQYYQQLVIFRTTLNATLWQQAQINITRTPAIFIVFSNRTAEQISVPQNNSDKLGNRNLFNQAIRSYILEKKLINNFVDNEFEEIGLSQNALKSSELKKQSYMSSQQAGDHPNTKSKNDKVTAVDLEAALSYMLRREIPRIKEIQGETYDSLLHWLIVLNKYFPGRVPVMFYLKRLLSKLKEQQNGLTGNQFRMMAEMNTLTAYLPDNQVQYKYCQGSAAQYRGYPCALWLLFHTMTVTQAQSESEIVNIAEIPMAIRSYIKHFFGCQHCSENFMNETSDINQLNAKNKYEAMIYLWKIHNNVNKRLHNDVTEDLEHQKVQFPSVQLCSNCQAPSLGSDIQFDMTNTIEFLQQFYSKKNLDFSSVYNYTLTEGQEENMIPQKGHQNSAKQYIMVELNDSSVSENSVRRFLPSVSNSFSFYIFLVIVIIVIFVRRRYCKSKRARYTL